MTGVLTGARKNVGVGIKIQKNLGLGGDGNVVKGDRGACKEGGDDVNKDAQKGRADVLHAYAENRECV